MSEDEIKYLIDIPGYPKYSLRTTDLRVISYCIHSEGYELKPQVDKYRRPGFRVWNDGVSEFLTLCYLEVLINRNSLRKTKSDMINRTTLQTNSYIIGSITRAGGLFSASSVPAVHPNLASAKVEAARLAGLDKTKKYVVLRVDGIASVQDVNWE